MCAVETNGAKSGCKTRSAVDTKAPRRTRHRIDGRGRLPTFFIDGCGRRGRRSVRPSTKFMATIQRRRLGKATGVAHLHAWRRKNHLERRDQWRERETERGGERRDARRRKTTLSAPTWVGVEKSHEKKSIESKSTLETETASLPPHPLPPASFEGCR